MGSQMSAADLNEAEALDGVIPMDHTEKMLGLIAFLLGKHLGMDLDESLCMPWVDTSDAALLGRIT